MAADPWSVFRSDGFKQNLLKTLWPDLYATLADPPGGRERTVRCAICGPNRDPKPAVGRLTKDGHPACAKCLELLSARPQGWPLARITEK